VMAVVDASSLDCAIFLVSQWSQSSADSLVVTFSNFRG
jgi:hypothetical protein